MKKVGLSSIYSQGSVLNRFALIAGSAFFVLALASLFLMASNRYVPVEKGSSFATMPSPPEDVERYFLTLLEEDRTSTSSKSGFPFELLFLPDTKKMDKCVSEEALKRIFHLAGSGNKKACQEEMASLGRECKAAVAAHFARRFAHSGDYAICEFFLQECREGFTYPELCDLDIQIVQVANLEDWKKNLLKKLQSDFVLPRNADETTAIQYVIRALFIARLLEEEKETEKATSIYKNAAESAGQWAADELPVSWRFILPAFLHFRLWRCRGKSVASPEDAEKALAWMRRSVPVNRWTWRYHQAVLRYARQQANVGSYGM